MSDKIKQMQEAPKESISTTAKTIATSTLTCSPRYEVWQPSPYKCPNCGSINTEYDTTMILTSNPHQSRCRCNDCKQGFFSGQCENQWQHDQSILDIPQVGDWPPAPTPCDPIGTPNQLNYGWICPKCGRCLAPHVDSCPHCSAATTINITY